MTEYMVNVSNDYGPKFHECIEVLINRSDKVKAKIPIMNIKCTHDYDEQHNQYFCNRVLAYFNAHLRNSEYITSSEFIKKTHTYKIMVHKGNDLNTI